MTPEQMLMEIERLRAELAEERDRSSRLLVVVESLTTQKCSGRVTPKAMPTPEWQPDLAWPLRQGVEFPEPRIRMLTPEEQAAKQAENHRLDDLRRAEQEKQRQAEIAARVAASRVYFIRQDEPSGLVKIGFTRRPVEKRLAELQKHHACTLVVAAVAPGLMSDERHLHDRFAHLRVSGEWFQPASDLMAYIQLVSDRGTL